MSETWLITTLTLQRLCIARALIRDPRILLLDGKPKYSQLFVLTPLQRLQVLLMASLKHLYSKRSITLLEDGEYLIIPK